jgi:hypothetical protein
MAEFKGIDIVRVDNHVRLLVTGNADWLVAAGREERRFAVLDVSDARMQDIPYFAALEKQMNEGGREALLDYLLNFDLSRVNLRVIPKTMALLEQKIVSLNPEQSWLFDLLRSGRLPWGEDGGDRRQCKAELIFAPGRKSARDRNDARDVFAEGVSDDPVAAAEGDDRLQAGANVPLSASRRMPATVRRRFWAVARSPVGR